MLVLPPIFPTGYQAADSAEIRPGDTVCVLGCGPVGQFAIWSAFQLGAGRVLAVDRVEDRLETARRLGAEIVTYPQTVAEFPIGAAMMNGLRLRGVRPAPARLAQGRARPGGRRRGFSVGRSCR